MVDKMSLFANDGFICEAEKIWYFANELSALIEVDRHSGDARVLTVLTEYFDTFSFRSIAKYRNEIYIFPFRGDKYAIYDLIGESYRYESIPNELINKNWSANYLRDGNVLYFAFQNPIIVRFDLETKSWEVIDLGELISNKEHCFGTDAFRMDDTLYFLLYHDKRIIAFNPKTRELKVISIRIPEDYSYIAAIAPRGDEVYYATESDDGEVSIFKTSVNTLDVSETICELRKEELASCTQLVVGTSNIWTLPGKGEFGYKISIDGGNAERERRIPCVQNDCLVECWGRAYNYEKRLLKDGSSIAIHPWTGRIIEFEDETGKIEQYEISVENVVDIWQKNKDKLCIENTYYSLNDFIYRLGE